jgi:hypothetical protein
MYIISGRIPDHLVTSALCSAARNMGKGRNRRSRRTQNDEFDSPPPLRYQSRGSSAYIPPFLHSGPPLPSIDSNSNFGTDNPFHRHRQAQQSRPNQPRHQNHNQSRPYLPTEQNHHVFLQKSQRLKQSLIRVFTQALRQIEQWYPDESPNGDLMDWQPEDEFVIPQPDNTVYNYGNGALQMGRFGYAREKVREVMFGTFPSGKLRAAGDVAVSGTSGCSTEQARWNGTSRRIPDPQSVSPLSNDPGGHHGIA